MSAPNFADFPVVLSALSGTTSQQSAVLVADGVYEIASTVPVRIAYGANPTADTSSAIVPSTYPKRIRGDGSSKVAVIHADGSTAFACTISRVG